VSSKIVTGLIALETQYGLVEEKLVGLGKVCAETLVQDVDEFGELDFP
jgi:hypothetical protein